MNLAERIKLVLNETGLNKTQFASRIKVTPATVAYWCSGRTKHLRGDYASRISRVFGYATFWLSEGQGPKLINNESGFPLVSALDTEKIPLIKIEDGEDKTKWKSDSFILTDLKMSSDAFSIEITDTSMSPIFQVGDRVIFDPGLVPKPGDFVIVRVKNEIPVFRKLKVLGFSSDLTPIFEFLPLNNDFPLFQSNQIETKILGVMTEHRRYRAKY